MTRSLIAIAAGIGAACCTTVSYGQLHTGDIVLDVQNGHIVTGAVDQDGQPEVGQRVFGATFGDSGFDGFTSNPGFDAIPGTFPTGTAIGFNALAGWKAWNGDGFEPTGGEALQISFGPLNTLLEDEPVAGFTLNVQADGGWHRHYSYTILGPPGDGPLPGIYLLELELYSTSSSIEPTEPFWKVFNHNMPNAVHEDAIDWVVENMVGADPCPADLDGDGAVDVQDLFTLLSQWGPCDGECTGDLDGNGAVDVQDLFILLSAWGQCP